MVCQIIISLYYVYLTVNFNRSGSFLPGPHRNGLDTEKDILVFLLANMLTRQTGFSLFEDEIGCLSFV